MYVCNLRNICNVFCHCHFIATYVSTLVFVDTHHASEIIIPVGIVFILIAKASVRKYTSIFHHMIWGKLLQHPRENFVFSYTAQLLHIIANKKEYMNVCFTQSVLLEKAALPCTQLYISVHVHTTEHSRNFPSRHFLPVVTMRSCKFVEHEMTTQHNQVSDGKRS